MIGGATIVHELSADDFVELMARGFMDWRYDVLPDGRQCVVKGYNAYVVKRSIPDRGWFGYTIKPATAQGRTA